MDRPRRASTRSAPASPRSVRHCRRGAVAPTSIAASRLSPESGDVLIPIRGAIDEDHIVGSWATCCCAACQARTTARGSRSSSRSASRSEPRRRASDMQRCRRGHRHGRAARGFLPEHA
jgi:hypothetical protein